jgi:uncharacterized RDD family membrane protein YckC
MDAGPPELNPYAPPTADAQADGVPDPRGPELASRWQRLGGAVVDGLLGALTAVPARIGTHRGFRFDVSVGPTLVHFGDATSWGVLSSVSAVALWILQSYFVALRGQSIGKMVAGTRIVALDGRPAPFVNAIVLRTWLAVALPLIPVVGGLVTLIDVLFVYRHDRRCVHDLVAGTKVIRAD